MENIMKHPVCTSQLQSNPSILPPRVTAHESLKPGITYTQYFDLHHPRYTTTNCIEQVVALYWDFTAQKQLKTKE